MFQGVMDQRQERKPRMSNGVPYRTCPRQDCAQARLFSVRARVIAILAAAAALLMLGPASSALADGPIQNPYFKDQGVAAPNTGTLLSGWATSTPGQVISTPCWTNVAGSPGFDCVPEPGTTIPVLGSAGSPAPQQTITSGGQGASGVFKTFRSTDVYNGDSEWKAGNPFGNTVIPQQSNYALIPTSCQNNQPAPNTLSQSFSAQKDQIITGFSFFTSQDWVPDRGSVTITAPDGSVTRVYRGRITGDTDQTPEGTWDHPVPPTVHYTHAGTAVMPHGQPATQAWIDAHLPGVSGTPWTRWTYRFPQDGTYTVTATARESMDPSFPVDCNMPSMLGMQFQTPTPIKDGLTVDVTPTSATYGDLPFSIANKATVYASRNPSLINPTGKGVTFSTADPDCSVTSAGKVTIKQVGDGVCNITVRAPGDFYYYAPETKTLPITINPKTLHVDAPDLSKAYGGDDPDASSQATLRESDLVGDDDLMSVLDLDHPGQPDCTISQSAGPDVGSYTGAIHCEPGTVNLTSPSPGAQPNYKLEPGRDGTLTITPADQTINLPQLSGRTVGDPNVDPGATASSGLPVSYVSASEDVCTITPGGTVHIEHAGTCVIIASQAGDGNYNAAQSVLGTFDVAKADQSIDFSPLSDQRFGDPGPTGDAHASSGLPVGFSSASPDVCTVDPDSGHVTVLASGTCAIVASQAGNDDYNAAQDVVRSFDVTTGDQAIEFPAPADKTYGDSDVDLGDLGATASSGLPVAYTAQGDCEIAGGKLHITGAGTCTVTASQDGDQRYGAAAPVQRTFTVHKASLTIRADDASRHYGDPNPAFTYSPSGLVNGETLAAVTNGAVSCDSPAGQASDAGSYAINCGGDLTSRNYDVTFAPGTLSVAKATLTVKANDANRRYGESNPAFDYALSGFVTGDGPAAVDGSASCSSSAGPSSDVGDYAIACAQGTLAANNYDFDFSAGTLSVHKAPLTIKADDKTRRYGEPNPSFTYGANGLVNGDTVASATSGAIDCSSPATQGSNVGTYAIVCGGDVASRDYDVGFVPGTLTVDPADQSISFGSLDDKFFGQEDFNVNAGASSGLPVSYAAQGDCTVDASGKVHLLSPSQWPGNCTLTATQDGNGNYNAAQSVSRSFKIATAALQGGGIFAVGNMDAGVGNNVNWWGSQWSKQNHLTGGSAPDAFKGYIDDISSYPPQCGTTWTTRPGNSSKPPSSVPQYMTVVVSSDVSKSGPTISGDVQSVVVVKTNAGYDSNPGHWGTGAVVAKLCGSKLNQSIDFPAPSDKTVGSPDFDPGAGASSGLPVAYSSSTPNICTIVGGKVHIVGPGNCAITASQGGNSIYNAATDVSRSFTVSLTPPIDCSGKKSKCESLLISPNPGAGATVRPGQTLTIGYTDDSRIGTGSLAPTAVLSDGRSLPVTVTPASGLALNYVTSYKRDYMAKNQALLSFDLPSDLSPGSYSIRVTANDGDGDVDQWNWPVTVAAP
jgi:MBG domain-containing protein